MSAEVPHLLFQLILQFTFAKVKYVAQALYYLLALPSDTWFPRVLICELFCAKIINIYFQFLEPHTFTIRLYTKTSFFIQKGCKYSTSIPNCTLHGFYVLAGNLEK
jgi:hypothetical protein